MKTNILMILFAATLLALPAVSQEPLCPPDQPCPKDRTCPENKNCPVEESNPRFCQCFSGLLSFTPSAGLLQRRVVIRTWRIDNQETVEIPHKGFLIVHLRAGALTTDIRGKEEKQLENSYWSVPAGVPLIVRTARDSVVLQTVDFSPAIRPEGAREPEQLIELLPGLSSY